MHKKKAMSQIERNAKYKKSNNIYRLSIDLKPEDKQMLDSATAEYGLTRKEFIVNCCKYCIDNGIKFDD